MEVVPIDDQISRHYAEIVVDLRRAGTPLPSNEQVRLPYERALARLTRSRDDHAWKDVQQIIKPLSQEAGRRVMCISPAS